MCMWADSSRVVQHRGPSLPYQSHSVVWHTPVQTSHVAHARSRIPPLSDRVRNHDDHVGISNQLRDEFQHSSYWSRVVGHDEEVVFAPLDNTAACEVCDSHHPARHTLIYIYISLSISIYRSRPPVTRVAFDSYANAWSRCVMTQAPRLCISL